MYAYGVSMIQMFLLLLYLNVIIVIVLSISSYYWIRAEDAPRMRDVYIDETLSDMDNNKDGFVTLDEYISE